MHISDNIQINTIANLLANELKNQNIPMPKDLDERDKILYESAENILIDNDINNMNDVIAEIKQFIKYRIVFNPNYFLTGDDFTFD